MFKEYCLVTFEPKQYFITILYIKKYYFHVTHKFNRKKEKKKKLVNWLMSNYRNKILNSIMNESNVFYVYNINKSCKTIYLYKNLLVSNLVTKNIFNRRTKKWVL